MFARAWEAGAHLHVMLIDLTTLASDRVPVVADIPPAALDVPAEDFAVKGPVHVEGDVERGSGESYHLRAQVRGTVVLTCARCAEPFELAALNTAIAVGLGGLGALAGERRSSGCSRRPFKSF